MIAVPSDKSTSGTYRIENARLVGREYNLRLSYTVEFDLNLLAGPEDWQALDEAEQRSPVLHSEPTDWDLIHHEVDAVREIYEDDPEAGEIVDWVDEPSAPSESTFWDDSKHFSDRYSEPGTEQEGER
ncbi:hypothetical protein SAMN06269185_1079 [Natronoarchaeum philippinense]|uniref:Uncharacterized protein n=1 Tax=Natronoarchaeum philippinense TaxID=558529 RepID=A0A285NA42_NATPI|nr:hypothetical protein SAMN06269185_1079 [Natronoarchaeum philippinense]